MALHPRPFRSRRAPLAAALALTALLSACSVSAGTKADDAKGTTATSAVDTTEPTGSTEPDATTTEPASDTGDVPDGSELFTNDDGTFTMSTNPTWVEGDQPGAGISLWYVAPVKDGFRSNLNVLTQDTGSMSLDDYLEESIPGVEGMLDDPEMLTKEVRTGAHGQEIGVLEYRGGAQGKDIHFYAVATQIDGGIALATLTMNESEHTELQDEIVPYLETLQAA